MTEPSHSTLTLGLIVNPIAGMGGAIANKGSDNLISVEHALAMGAEQRAHPRTVQALTVLKQALDNSKNLPQVTLLTCAGMMGERAAKEAGFEPEQIELISLNISNTPSAQDTIQAAKILTQRNVALLLFAGGDGTARNLCEAIGDDRIPVLGIPAGVKIHSAVYAVTPNAAGEVAAKLVRGELLSLVEQDVRDLDEDLFRQGKVQAKYFGSLRVPQSPQYMQNIKSSGEQVEALVLDDIANDFIDQMDEDTRYIMGSGSTVAHIMDTLGLNNTLLGVDVIENGELIASDCTAHQLLELTQTALDNNQPVRIVITLIGGQGHLIGRGNQQLSAELLKRLFDEQGSATLHVVATSDKLTALNGAPLIIDSGDDALNAQLSGSIEVHTGYEESVLYRVSTV